MTARQNKEFHFSSIIYLSQQLQNSLVYFVFAHFVLTLSVYVQMVNLENWRWACQVQEVFRKLWLQLFCGESSIVAIANIFYNMSSVFMTFCVWNNFKLYMLQGNKCFYAFPLDMLWEIWGKSFFTIYNKYS